MDRPNIKLIDIIGFLSMAILLPIMVLITIRGGRADFLLTGPIGDTIGGLTAPFINSVAAVLVYLAFKEQIKANELIREQIYFQHLQEQISRLEDKAMDAREINSRLIKNIKNVLGYDNLDGVELSFLTNMHENLFSSYQFLARFKKLYEDQKKMKNEGSAVLQRLAFVYRLNFSDSYSRLKESLEALNKKKFENMSHYESVLISITKIEEHFSELDFF